MERIHRILIQHQEPDESIRTWYNWVKTQFTRYELPNAHLTWPVVMGALGSYRTQLPIWKTENLEEWITKVEELEAQTVANINRSQILRSQNEQRSQPHKR